MAERTTYATALTKKECGLFEGWRLKFRLQDRSLELSGVTYHLHWLSCERTMIGLEPNALVLG